MALSEKLVEWLAGYDTGLSSLAILAWMERDVSIAAMLHNHLRHPSDPADLGRCIRLMDIEPSYRQRIGEMAAVSPQWARLAAHWSELEALYYKADHQGRAEACYQMMRALIDGKTEEEIARIMWETENAEEMRRRRYIADTEHLYNHSAKGK